jgi:hypothetical protein
MDGGSSSTAANIINATARRQKAKAMQRGDKKS